MIALPGRLHPALVHFPIALLIVGALGLLLPAVRRSPGAYATLRMVFGLGALGALVAAGSGWLFANQGFYGGADAKLLLYHRWMGVGVAVTAGLATLLLRGQRGAALGQALALCAALGVGAVGYLGGELVFGEGHLWGAFSSQDRTPTLPEVVSLELAQASAKAPGPGDPLVFRRDVRPVLRRSCYKCHGPEKQKGGLRLDQREDLLRGGDSGPAVVPGNPDDGELLRRILLPPDDDDFMPRKGSALSPEEIGLLKRWISDGASFD